MVVDKKFVDEMRNMGEVLMRAFRLCVAKEQHICKFIESIREPGAWDPVQKEIDDLDKQSELLLQFKSDPVGSPVGSPAVAGGSPPRKFRMKVVFATAGAPEIGSFIRTIFTPLEYFLAPHPPIRETC